MIIINKIVGGDEIIHMHNLQELINNLNKFSSLYSLLINLLMAIFTAIYVILTHKLVKETKKAREENNVPEIIVDIESKGILIIAKIINTSTAIAKNINIKSQPELKCFAKPILFISPNKEINYIIGYINQNINYEYRFEISYQDINNKKYVKNYSINIEPIIEQDTINDNRYLKDIVDRLKSLEYLRDINSNLSDIKNSSKDIAKKVK